MNDELNAAADVRAIMDRVTPIARELLKQAHILSPDPVDQVGAMIVAMTSIIEKEVGRDKAWDCLAGMLQPTMLDWQTPLPGTTQH